MSCDFRVVDTENVLQRMTIIGVLLSFRSLAQEALLDVGGATVDHMTHSVIWERVLNSCS